jgi:hypothetical protein
MRLQGPDAGQPETATVSRAEALPPALAHSLPIGDPIAAEPPPDDVAGPRPDEVYGVRGDALVTVRASPVDDGRRAALAHPIRAFDSGVKRRGLDPFTTVAVPDGPVPADERRTSRVAAPRPRTVRRRGAVASPPHLRLMRAGDDEG